MGPPVRFSVLSMNASPANIGIRSEASSSAGTPVMRITSGSPMSSMNITVSVPAALRIAAPTPRVITDTSA
ncbi:hypothetical protein ACFQQB_52230 [Nonomuraea rubra]|uniref:hypothetical protein n=1 Tax=Nonomuraea rubra TaxID=46180 RepID=UPI003614C1AC